MSDDDTIDLDRRPSVGEMFGNALSNTGRFLSRMFERNMGIETDVTVQGGVDESDIQKYRAYINANERLKAENAVLKRRVKNYEQDEKIVGHVDIFNELTRLKKQELDQLHEEDSVDMTELFAYIKASNEKGAPRLSVWSVDGICLGGLVAIHERKDASRGIQTHYVAEVARIDKYGKYTGHLDEYPFNSYDDIFRNRRHLRRQLQFGKVTLNWHSEQGFTPEIHVVDPTTGQIRDFEATVQKLKSVAMSKDKLARDWRHKHDMLLELYEAQKDADRLSQDQINFLNREVSEFREIASNVLITQAKILGETMKAQVSNTISNMQATAFSEAWEATAKNLEHMMSMTKDEALREQLREAYQLLEDSKPARAKANGGNEPQDEPPPEPPPAEQPPQG